MNHFVKIYGSILRSSIWMEDHATRLLWIAMLIEADADGFVAASRGGMAHTARLSLEEFDKAINILTSPDPDSRTPDEHDGRRVEKVDGGWRIFKYKHYRDMRTPGQVQEAEKKARWRKRGTQVDSGGQSTMSTGEVEVEVEGEVDTTTTKASSPAAKSEQTGTPPNWPARLALLWRSHVGAISIPRVGKVLKELVDEHGEDVVEKAMLRYVKETEKEKPKKLEWFAEGFQRWKGERFTGPMIVGGWMSDELERATRP